MAFNTYTIGDTLRIWANNVAAVSPTTALMREADSKWLDASDGSWNSTIVNNPMTELDPANFPGIWFFDFDQSLDDIAGSVRYWSRTDTTGSPSYGYWCFGAISVATSPSLCGVQGRIFGSDGEGLSSSLVRAVLEPVKTDDTGRGYQSDVVTSTYTDVDGNFDLPLVRSAIYRLEIPSIGYDRRVEIPDQATALFTAL